MIDASKVYYSSSVELNAVQRRVAEVNDLAAAQNITVERFVSYNKSRQTITYKASFTTKDSEQISFVVTYTAPLGCWVSCYHDCNMLSKLKAYLHHAKREAA